MLRIDYSDEYSKPCERPQDGHELVHRFTSAALGNGAKLMRLRDAIVGRFGLKTSAPFVVERRRSLQVGEAVGIFRILAMGDHSAVLGEDDSHLDFRITLTSTSGVLRLRTDVMFHNRLGRCYFAVIKPFHHLLARRVLAKM